MGKVNVRIWCAVRKAMMTLQLPPLTPCARSLPGAIRRCPMTQTLASCLSRMVAVWAPAWGPGPAAD